MTRAPSTIARKPGPVLSTKELSSKTLRGWFSDAGRAAGWPVPDAQQLSELRYHLNIYANVPHFISRPPGPDYFLPERNRLKVAKAATDLIKHLPQMIDNARATRMSATSQGVESFLPASLVEKFETLLQSANALPPFYRDARKPNPRGYWHEAAYIIWYLTQKSWRDAGRKPQYPKPTSPSVVVTASALEWLGIRQKVDTVSKVLVRML